MRAEARLRLRLVRDGVMLASHRGGPELPGRDQSHLDLLGPASDNEQLDYYYGTKNLQWNSYFPSGDGDVAMQNLQQGPARQLREAKKSKDRVDYLETKRKLSGHEINMKVFIDAEMEGLQILVDQSKSTEDLVKENEAEIATLEQEFVEADKKINVCQEATRQAQKAKDNVAERLEDAFTRLNALKDRLKKEIEESKVGTAQAHSTVLPQGLEHFGAYIKSLQPTELAGFFDALLDAAIARNNFDPVDVVTKVGAKAQKASAKRQALTKDLVSLASGIASPSGHRYAGQRR